jgi:hypothetical protein
MSQSPTFRDFLGRVRSGDAQAASELGLRGSDD